METSRDKEDCGRGREKRETELIRKPRETGSGASGGVWLVKPFKTELAVSRMKGTCTGGGK